MKQNEGFHFKDILSVMEGLELLPQESLLNREEFDLFY